MRHDFLFRIFLELPRGLGVHELAGGFGLPGAQPLSAAVEESFRRGVQALPQQTCCCWRRLAEPLGDPVLLWRAPATLGIGADAGAPAAAAGLAEFGVRVRFRHPLARSAVYRSASVRERQAVQRNRNRSGVGQEGRGGDRSASDVRSGRLARAKSRGGRARRWA
jgi:hypothetical protein